MWFLVNDTPLPAEFGWAQDPDGAKRWIVAVKATFLLEPPGGGRIPALHRLAPEQAPIHRVNVASGERGKSPPLAETDLAPLKQRTDVLLNGSAYTPEGKPAVSVDATLRVSSAGRGGRPGRGLLRKTVRVVGDRRWERGALGLSMSAPRPFVRMPVGYDRAYGGHLLDEEEKIRALDTRNPVGTGFAERAEEADGMALPNLEDPLEMIGSHRDRPRPMAFGPIEAHWEPRRSLAGTYDERWMRERRPLLAEDFDVAHYQHAPPDQQAPGFLRGGEVVELFHLTPEGYRAFSLPKLKFGMITWAGGGGIPHPMRLHTVLIEPDKERVMLTYQGNLRVGRDAAVVQRSRVFEKKRIRRDDVLLSALTGQSLPRQVATPRTYTGQEGSR